MQKTRLLIAFDALLRVGSVTQAAEDVGIQTSAMSRVLSELRKIYDDELFIRTGQGMRPTPLAESLRLRVRALAHEASELLFPTADRNQPPSAAEENEWQHPTVLPMPPLASNREPKLDVSPTPETLSRKISEIDHRASPAKRLAKYIAVTCPGPGKSRPLTQREAKDCFDIILNGHAHEIQIGALLMTIQHRGITAPELAGFIEAVRENIISNASSGIQPDLDWPAYISANWRHAPWFIHSARLLAEAGHKILLHGYFGNGPHSGKLELAMNDCAIPVCTTLENASQVLNTSNIAYEPLGAISPQMQALLDLYHLVETRLPVHYVSHLVNPLNAKSIILGAAQLSKRDLYRDVAHLLKYQNATIVGSVRDFAQIAPQKTTPLYRICNGQSLDTIAPGNRMIADAPPRHIFTQREHWQAVWTGSATDEMAENIITYTAAAALISLPQHSDMSFETALSHAQLLWRDRNRAMSK